MTTSPKPMRGNSRVKNQTSINTISIILESARNVLIQHGHAGFTTRRVAEAAEISPGNLSYHYPNKHDLIQALISKMLGEYLLNFEQELNKAEKTLNISIETLAEWLMTDAVSDSTMRTFRELWAMSLHDESIRTMVDDFYDVTIEKTTVLISHTYPAVEIEKIREIMYLLAMIAEGGIVLYGSRKTRAVSYERIKELVIPFCAKAIFLDTAPALE